jgi:hypothetical protein
MKTLEEVYSCVIWTGWLKGEKPVSLLIIAEPEEGKTTLLNKSKSAKGLVYLTDATAYGIARMLEEKKNLGEMVNHIIIPDLLSPLSKQKSTVDTFLSFINPLIEEGITYIRTASITLKYDFQCGVITAVTKGKWSQHKKVWNDIGFMSRFVPVSYGYSMGSVQKILQSSAEKGYRSEGKFDFDFPKEKVEIELDKDLAEKLIPISTALGAKLGTHGIRLQKNLQTMMMAHALMNGRTKTIQEDLDSMIKFSDYINFDFKKI